MGNQRDSRPDKVEPLYITEEMACDDVMDEKLQKQIKKEADEIENCLMKSEELKDVKTPDGMLDEIIGKLKNKGIRLGFVTLHVGLGTFRPVKVDDVTEHKMHSEHYEISQEVADLILETKKNGGRVIGVGTTSCRTVESVATFEGQIKASEGWTNIFIYPGYEFKVLDGLITNFHLPESTLIMLVSAFAGYDHTMQAYKTAVQERYRFFSFGDSMMIL